MSLPVELYLGIDVGTSGIRAAVIDDAEKLVAEAQTPLPEPDSLQGRPAQDPMLWWQTLDGCLQSLRKTLAGAGRSMADIAALAVDGTSGTMLLADADLNPLTLGLMYNSSGFDAEAAQIAAVAPADAIANSPSSALARLLYLQQLPEAATACYALHQADWIAARLMGHGGLSDENNALKLGYDPALRCWPEWFARLDLRTSLLPKVNPVGTRIGNVAAQTAKHFGFNPQMQIAAGTTDSTAAFIGTGASEPGDAVTSLGTTLAVKLLSSQPITDASRGIYSHRIGDMWLAGGASNTGGGALQQFFSTAQMKQLEAQLDPAVPTGLDYYPLPRPGERFPVADPQLAPRMDPRPADDAQFFQGLLEGVARIEQIGYAALGELGAPRLRRVITVGGGAANAAWTAIRAGMLGCKVLPGKSSAAAGAARVASGGFLQDAG